jgi:hypothetical protein
MQLTSSFLDLLQDFRTVFTSPTFLTFVTIVTGWCYSWRHRYVTELILASDATQTKDTTVATIASSVGPLGRSMPSGASWQPCCCGSSPPPA